MHAALAQGDAWGPLVRSVQEAPDPMTMRCRPAAWFSDPDV